MSEYKPFTPDLNSEEANEIINTWFQEAEPYHNFLLRKQNEMVEYYLGNQTHRFNVAPFNSDSVYNRIFEATETLIPIITGPTHQFIAVPAEENEVSLGRAKSIQKALTYQYENLNIRAKLEVAARDVLLKRFAVLEYGWDSEKDDVGIWVRDPRSIYIPKLPCDPHDLPYAIRVGEYSEDQMYDYFPDMDIEKLAYNQKRQVSRANSTQRPNGLYQVEIVYTPETLAYRCGTEVQLQANPYFDFGEETVIETRINETGEPEEIKEFKQSNHLRRPTIPLVFIAPFRTGDGPISEVSLAEVGAPIQDDINVGKRQIIDNLRRMGNGQVYLDKGVLSEEEEANLSSEPGLVVSGPNIASENRMRREPATPIPSSHFANLQDSMAAFDSVFGTHGAIRGASTNETLGGQMLDRQQNMSRIEALTRELNRAVARLADGITQVMKLYYTEPMVLRMLDQEGAVEFLRFKASDIESGLVIHTKSGTPPLLDPQARYNQAIQLWQLGALDPETLFERLEFADPQIAAQKLAAWKAGQVLFESQIRANQEAEASPETATTPERDVETPDDAMARARASATNSGDGVAPLTNTPN